MRRITGILAAIRSTLARRAHTARGRGVIVACLTSAVALAIAPAFAQSRPPMKPWQARFVATVEGSQKSSWTLHHVADPAKDPCDNFNGRGSGSQTTDFNTSRVMTTMVLGVGNGEPLLAPIRGTSKSMGVRGTMTRNGTAVWTQIPGTSSPCSGGEENPPPPPKADCGKKPLGNWGLELEYNDPNVISLVLSDITPLMPPQYKHCPLFGPDRWGMLPAEARLPESELRDHGQVTVIGNQHKSKHEADYDSQATFHWKLTLKRVK
jgi:hypothetical protein